MAVVSMVVKWILIGVWSVRYGQLVPLLDTVSRCGHWCGQCRWSVWVWSVGVVSVCSRWVWSVAWSVRVGSECGNWKNSLQCGQCVWSVSVVTADNGYGQWVWSVGHWGVVSRGGL